MSQPPPNHLPRLHLMGNARDVQASDVTPIGGDVRPGPRDRAELAQGVAVIDSDEVPGLAVRGAAGKVGRFHDAAGCGGREGLVLELAHKELYRLGSPRRSPRLSPLLSAFQPLSRFYFPALESGFFLFSFLDSLESL